MQREVMTHSSHRIRYWKSLAGQSLVQSTAKLCRAFKKTFLLPTYASMKTCAQPAWSEPAQTDSSRKCLHSDICLNVKRSCCTIMNTKWINNDIWIMNTIYSSSDKILSFLACTCVNYLTQASVAACQGSLLAHHRHLLSLGRMAASLKACIPSLSVLSHYQTSICFKKSLAFQRWALILLSVTFVANNLELLWAKILIVDSLFITPQNLNTGYNTILNSKQFFVFKNN